MLSRLPWTPKPETKARRKGIAGDRHGVLISRVAELLRRGEPTAFAFEAASRHAIRSALCLSGVAWAMADEIAAGIVQAALDRIGAKRPTWQQGQPEYVQFGVVFVERTRCRHCGKRLPEGQRTYCGRVCKEAHAYDRADLDRRAEKTVAVKLWWAAWSAAQPRRTCASCGCTFKPRRPEQRFCRNACVNRANSVSNRGCHGWDTRSERPAGLVRVVRCAIAARSLLGAAEVL